jgi:hypothetical protein
MCPFREVRTRDHPQGCRASGPGGTGDAASGDPGQATSTPTRETGLCQQRRFMARRCCRPGLRQRVARQPHSDCGVLRLHRGRVPRTTHGDGRRRPCPTPRPDRLSRGLDSSRPPRVRHVSRPDGIAHQSQEIARRASRVAGSIFRAQTKLGRRRHGPPHAATLPSTRPTRIDVRGDRSTLHTYARPVLPRLERRRRPYPSSAMSLSVRPVRRCRSVRAWRRQGPHRAGCWPRIRAVFPSFFESRRDDTTPQAAEPDSASSAALSSSTV